MKSGKIENKVSRTTGTGTGRRRKQQAPEATGARSNRPRKQQGVGSDSLTAATRQQQQPEPATDATRQQMQPGNRCNPATDAARQQMQPGNRCRHCALAKTAKRNGPPQKEVALRRERPRGWPVPLPPGTAARVARGRQKPLPNPFATSTHRAGETSANARRGDPGPC